jgi:hypothetical protein
MRYSVIKTAFVGTVLALFVLAGGPAVQAQTCTENTASVTETFSDGTNLDLTASSAKFWYNDASNPQGIMTLNKLGSNFTVANPTSVPSWVMIVTTNDFNLDGWPDYIATASGYSNCLAFVQNMGVSGSVGTFTVTHWIDGCTGDASGWPTKGVKGTAIDTLSRHNGITSGDYDGDGDIDFLYVVSSNVAPHPIVYCWLYRNNIITGGVNTGTLSFTQVDLLSAWSSVIKGVGWTATFMESTDLDGDGDIDVALGNKDGEIYKITNMGNGAVNASTFDVDSTPIITTGFGGQGTSVVTAADFDGSGSVDIIAASVSTADIQFWSNDGTGQFTLAATFTDGTGDLHNNMYDGAGCIGMHGDFDKDGDEDFVIGTDNWNYPYSGAGYGGKCYYFMNDGAANFTVTLVYDGPTKSPVVTDFDLGAVFDFDNDGDLDFLIADGNHSKYYYIFVNSIADVFNLSGVGLSVNLSTGLPDTQYAITKARLTFIDQSTIGGSSTGLSVTYYLSNDDGATWELWKSAYSGSNISNVTYQSDSDYHSFNTFGSKLRWKAVLAASDDSISAYPNSSYETPSVDRLVIEYTYVERREYSRSSAAAAAIISGTRRKLIISASFMFPGYQGQLRAYDVTDIALASTGGSTIQTISTADPLSPTGRNVTAGGSILWDAGQLLASRSYSDRTIYAGYRANSTSPYQRVDFTEANVNTLKSLLSDSNGDNAGLIRFVRGEGRTWKLGDVLHSSPVLMGPPSGDSTALGVTYAAFVTANASRTPVIFIGANDGMLHCFNLASGVELWGFIPYNLLPKLKNMSGWDSTTGVRYYKHDYFVDGTPTVGDVYFGGKWRTVLMCGQGAGKGSTVAGGLNYYFALDVTDPANPLVLWEAKDSATMGETWSVPAFGQVLSSSTYYWVAFVGSGYDNDTTRTIGNRFYIINLETGAILKTLTVTNDADTSKSSCPNPYTNIQVTVPGSPAAVDTNRDGRTEYVYFGDLDGRLYRVPLTSSNTSNWKLETIYTDRVNYPIITKPALYPDPASGGLPLGIYFGTGGDDSAPADRKYAFIAMKDTGSSASLEWYIGDATETGLSSSSKVAEMSTGEKVWSDPVISDKIVYFSSLMGSIENVNPCLNLAQQGRLYARFVQTVAGSVFGSSAFKNAGGATMESLQLASKARKAVTVGELQAGGGSSSKKEVYIQEYDSTIERLEQPVGSSLRVVSWREIYKIIR